MNDLYEWLYDHYAQPMLNDASFPSTYQAQMQEWLDILARLPTDERLLCIDLLDSLNTHWGTQAFACGVQTGLLLADSSFQHPDPE